MAFTEVTINAYQATVKKDLGFDEKVEFIVVGHEGVATIRLGAGDAARLSYRLAEQAKKIASDITYWATPEEVLGEFDSGMRPRQPAPNI